MIKVRLKHYSEITYYSLLDLKNSIYLSKEATFYTSLHYNVLVMHYTGFTIKVI